MEEDVERIREMIDSIEFLKESSLSRVWQHVQNRTPFAIISLSRGDMLENEKIEAFNTLKDMTRKMGYGYIEMKGGFVESGGNDRINELSLMSPKMSREDAIKIGQTDLGYGPQDSVLYCDGKDFLGYISTNANEAPIGANTMIFKYGKDIDALPMTKEAIKDYFSMLAKGNHKHRKFAFIPESFQLFEMRDRKSKYKEGDWWDNYGRRIN